MAVAWVAVPSLLFWSAAAWIIWSLYKQALKIYTQSLPPAGAEVVDHLIPVSNRPQRVALAVLGGVCILVAIAVLIAVQRVHP
jgi:hypothetical protein